MFRATVHNAAHHPRVHDELEDNRRLLREQFQLQFAPELSALPKRARTSALEAGNVLTQPDSIDQLRRVRNLTVAKARIVLTEALAALLNPADPES